MIGVDSDRLFPVAECAELARQIPGAQYRQVTSSSGHDGFLVETRQVEKILADFVAGL